MIKKFTKESADLLSGALFISGSGSNAEKILEFQQKKCNSSWKAVVIVTDNPLKSRATEIANKYNLPCVALDIRQFYNDRGESRVSIMSEKGRIIREEWTAELRRLLKPFNIDFGLLAGFVPLTNITTDYPCLNIHPGDLTVEDDERRILVGLHTIPVEIAILHGLLELRSSVIIAQSYSGAGGEMDSGPILGISTPVEIDFMGYSLSKLKDLASKRVAKRPVGGFKDELEDVAKHNQELLKEGGDWVVFPQVVEAFAAGLYALDEQKSLLFKQNKDWINIKTIEYGIDCSKIIYGG